MTKTYHLLIHGRVQGVGYRAWMASRARELGLNGWVRNRRDGTVEAVIAGEEPAVAKILAGCREGTLASKVTGVDVADSSEEVEPGFVSKVTV